MFRSALQLMMGADEPTPDTSPILVTSNSCPIYTSHKIIIPTKPSSSSDYYRVLPLGNMAR